MRKISCIVVDDEPLAVEMLAGYVCRTPSLELAGSYTDPVQALSEIRASKPDVVFMDIQMPDISGLELSRMLPKETRVIFTTAFRQYALDSYEVEAIDYLLKPIRYQKFLEAVAKAENGCRCEIPWLSETPVRCTMSVARHSSRWKDSSATSIIPTSSMSRR